MDNASTLTLLALMAGFCVKHWVADYLLQTARMVREKGHYGRLGGILHAGVHAVCSSLVLWPLGVPLATTAAFVVGEFILHYHIDFGKETLSRRLGDSPANHRFWIVLGFDQMLHHLTYAAMIILALPHLV